MTYDKVQFTLNKHHYEQKRNGEDSKPVDPAVEVEKVSISPERYKRKSSAYDSALPNINEVTAERKCSENVSINNEFKDQTFRLEDWKDTNGQEHILRHQNKVRGELENTITKIHTGGQQSKTSRNNFVVGKNSSAEEMSGSTRSSHFRGNGSDINILDKQNNSGLSRGKEASETSEVVDSEPNMVVDIPKLDLGQESTNERQTQANSFSYQYPIKGTGVGSPLTEQGGESTKSSNVKCEHILARQTSGQDFFLTKKFDVNKNIKISQDKCMICEVTEATAKYASVEANRLLLELVYPHEFYDKFQRSGKRTKATANQKNLDTAKEQISICKPVPVASKSWRRERTTILPPQSSAPDQTAHSNTAREMYRSKLRERSDHDLTPQKRIKREVENENKKEIHLQCRAKNNALVITDDSERQKLVLKGLKGWILKKDDLCKNTLHKEIKKSLYKVSSLGMKFSIPEYNTSLSDRKPQTAHLFTCMTSPCPIDVQQPIRKSVTQNISPRNHMTPARDIQTVPTRNINGLQRGYTYVPKLISETTVNSLKGVKNADDSTTSDNKPIENGSSFPTGSKVSLPPISNNLKSRSLTLSQFQ